jgi:hypothetical protein
MVLLFKQMAKLKDILYIAFAFLYVPLVFIFAFLIVDFLKWLKIGR